MRFQHLVFELAAFKENAFAIHGCYHLQMICMMYTKLSPIFCLPIIVQVHDN